MKRRDELRPTMTSVPLRGHRRRGRPSLGWAWLATLCSLWAAPLAGLQEFEPGRRPADVEVSIARQPYELHGGSGEEILAELEALAPVEGVVWFALEYTWDYELERVGSAIAGVPSTECRLTDFSMRFDFSTVYPEWVRPDDASPELIAAWDAFGDLVTRSWEARRDEDFARAREVFADVRDREDTCDGFGERLRTVITERMDGRARSPGLGSRAPVPGVTWPPPGHEAVMAPPPPRPAPSAERSSARRTTEVRSGPDVVERALGPSRTRSGSTVSSPLGAPRVEAATARAAEPSPRMPPLPDLLAAIRADLDGVGLEEPPVGFAVGLAHEGEAQLLDAFGTTTSDAADSMTVERAFPFPAFTEVLVSTLAAALGEVGILDLDAPISRILPDLAPRLGSATLRQLISHRAGLDNAPPRDTTAAWDTVLDRLSDRALVTDPGTLYSYSRYSYGLAVRVIETRLGMSIEEAVRQSILSPLGLDGTSFGAREADDAVDELPIAYTTVPDLMVFWLSWMDGQIAGSGPDVLASAPTDGPAGAGHSFYRGFWVDRFGEVDRIALLCGASGGTAGFEVLPGSRTVLALGGSGGLPLYTTVFLLGRVGDALGVGNAIYGPRPLDGGASPNRSRRRCEPRSVTWSNLVTDFGSPAAAQDWAGRYLNGELRFVLDDVGGTLVALRGSEEPYTIFPFDGDTFFAIVDDARRPFGFPVQLLRDERGRRYVRVGDRTYVHEADR